MYVCVCVCAPVSFVTSGGPCGRLRLHVYFLNEETHAHWSGRCWFYLSAFCTRRRFVVHIGRVIARGVCKSAVARPDPEMIHGYIHCGSCSFAKTCSTSSMRHCRSLRARCFCSPGSRESIILKRERARAKPICKSCFFGSGRRRK